MYLFVLTDADGQTPRDG